MGERAFALLLSRSRNGESEAVDELFELFYPNVQGMVHAGLAKDLRSKRPWLIARFSTGDVVQEVFKSVLGDIKSFGGTTPASFAGFLSVVVRNRILDAVRFHEAACRDGRKSNGEVPAEPVDTQELDPAQAVLQQEEMRRFQCVMSSFAEREQILLRARFEGTETLANLTEQLGYPSLATTRRTFLAAKARLAVMLEED